MIRIIHLMRSFSRCLEVVPMAISTSPYKEAWTEYKAQATLYTTTMCTPLLLIKI
jgi:hypothetical protein